MNRDEGRLEVGYKRGADLPEPASKRRAALFVAGTLFAVVTALLAFSMLLRPTANEFLAMSAFLTLTAVISGIAGLVAFRLGWMRRSPGLTWTLMAGYLLAGLLSFLNVLLTARLMFLNRHDLLLSTVLLVFAAIIAVSLGYLFSTAVAASVRKLNKAADAVAGGDLDVEAAIEGPEEIAALARSFNRMTQQLREVQLKREDLDTARRHLLTAVGHDLRTPLTSVRVIIEALADGVVDDPETTARYLATARSDLDTLSLLVDDLFTLAQLDSGALQLEVQPNSLADLISDTLESFSVRAQKKGIRLTGQPLPDLPELEFDAKYVGRALANLVENALRHTPAGGEIAIRVGIEPSACVVYVSDTGSGIAEADLPHIFERFYRSESSRNRATGGSGLGLTIVKEIAEAHRGHVEVVTNLGVGTTFSLVLPAP